MTSQFIVPTFDKFTPNKVHNKLAVTGQNTVSNPTGKSREAISAIATESIPVKVDGEYVFAVRIDNIVDAQINIGVTPMETFDSNEESYPGKNGMTGSALYLCDGCYYPCSSPILTLIDRTITTKAKEVIVVITIVNNGAQILIRWIVDGTSSKIHDCTADCNGNKFFPVVTLYEQGQQITMIPIDQITIRNDVFNKLIEKSSKSSSSNQGAVANNSNQQQLSSAALAQLQQELEKERKRADLAETQLQQEKQQHEKEKQVNQQQSSEIAQLKQQLLTLQSQLNNRD